MKDGVSELEFAALKRARRLLRICDIAVTKTADNRRKYLERACYGDAILLAEAQAVLDAVDESKEFFINAELFPSLPPRSD